MRFLPKEKEREILNGWDLMSGKKFSRNYLNVKLAVLCVFKEEEWMDGWPWRRKLMSRWKMMIHCAIGVNCSLMRVYFGQAIEAVMEG